MQKVSLRLRLVLAGAAFFALSGSANESTITVVGNGRGAVPTVHRHGILYTTASFEEIRNGAQDLARTAAYEDARDKCDRLNGHLVDGASSKNTTYAQAVPRMEDANDHGDPVFVLTAKTTLKCAVPSKDKDVRVSNASGAKPYLVTHSDGSIWSVDTEGRSFQVLGPESKEADSAK